MTKIVTALLVFGLAGCSSCEDKPSGPEKRSSDESGPGTRAATPAPAAGEPGAPANDPAIVAGQRLMAAEQNTLTRAQGLPQNPGAGGPSFQPVARLPRFFDIPANGPNMKKRDAGR